MDLELFIALQRILQMMPMNFWGVCGAKTLRDCCKQIFPGCGVDAGMQNQNIFLGVWQYGFQFPGGFLGHVYEFFVNGFRVSFFWSSIKNYFPNK